MNTNMKKYDYNWSVSIKRLFDSGKYYDALKEYENYLELYPKDTGSLIPYADILIRLGELEHAKYVLEKIEYLATDLTFDKYYNSLKIKYYNRVKEHIKALEFFFNLDHTFFNVPLDRMVLESFLRRYADLKPIYNDIEVYLLNQIINYSDEESLEHIIKTHFNIEVQEDNCVFDENIDPELLFNEIKNKINEEYVIYHSVVSDISVFNLSNVGYQGGKTTNFLQVVTLPHTNDIITMYPTNEYLRVRYQTLDEKVKTKKI